MSLRVYSTKLRAWVSLAILDAEEATLKEGGGVSYGFSGHGENRAVSHAAFTGVREGGPAFLICAGLQGAICSLMPDGRAQWSVAIEPAEEALPALPFALDLATRPTQRPAAN